MICAAEKDEMLICVAAPPKRVRGPRVAPNFLPPRLMGSEHSPAEFRRLAWRLPGLVIFRGKLCASLRGLGWRYTVAEKQVTDLRNEGLACGRVAEMFVEVHEN